MRATLPLLLFASACQGIPEAPLTFNELCVFVWDNLGEEDPAALSVALDNLTDWLEGNPADEPEDGYSIDPLEPEMVEGLGDEEHTTQGVRGGAVVSEGRWPPVMFVEPLILEDQTMVFPELFLSFDREFEGSPECFASANCEWVGMVNDVHAELPLGVETRTLSTGEFRWIDTSRGKALLHRSWKEGEVEINVSWLRIEEQYYMGMVLPREGGGVYCLEAAWMAAEISVGNVPENMALKMAIKGMRNKHELLFDYLEGGS